MRDPITVCFGDQSWVIRPLTLGQVERIERLVADPEMLKGGSTRQSIEIMKVALSRDNAAVDIAEAEATLAELAAATSAVLRLGGFMPQDDAPGEAVAASA